MISNFQIAYPPIKTKLVHQHENNYSFTVEPLLPGFGHTLGNALRRTMLSSIPGFAVTRIRINDLTHEYQPIPGVVEDAVDVILNLKNLRCKILTDDETVVLTLHKTGQGEVTAADFDKNSKVEVVNPSLYICSLDKTGDISIEVEISAGVGYLRVDDINLSNSTNPQDILVDAVFTPIANIAFEVEKVRVGDNTNYDKISINFDTDGSVEAKDVVSYALKLVVDLYQNILSGFQASLDTAPVQTPVKDVEVITSIAPSQPKQLNSHDEELNLPTRIKNILEKNGVYTNSDLKNRVDDVENFAGIGESALVTIKDYIKTIS